MFSTDIGRRFGLKVVWAYMKGRRYGYTRVGCLNDKIHTVWFVFEAQ
jgi:hypothetical protein